MGRNRYKLPLKITWFFLTTLVFLFFSAATVLAQTPEEERQALEQELKALDEQATKIENDIKATQKEKQTLQNQITTLQNKIKKLDVEIRQGNLMIEDLKIQVTETEGAIERTTTKLGQTKEELKSLLRILYQENQRSGFEVFLEKSSLSDFFGNVANIETLNVKISQSLDRVKSLKTSLEDEKNSLDQEQEDMQKIIGVQLLQKQANESNKKQQETILAVTKGKETLYQQYLKETQEKAAQIRSRIFELIGVQKAPTFGEAYDIAKFVSGITGVRPAFLLAIFTQESNIGKNVGQCYLADASTGEGIRSVTNKREPRTMSVKRDVPLFLSITKELGRDPYNTPVSCPLSYGTGGAMGPAQFIPSTWVVYRDKVKTITGKAADPWDIRDAFLAAGLYLEDLGAASNEWRAAMRYYSGATWNWYEEKYGNSVIALANQYENDIKELEKQLGIKNATRE